PGTPAREPARRGQIFFPVHFSPNRRAGANGPVPGPAGRAIRPESDVRKTRPDLRSTWAGKSRSHSGRTPAPFGETDNRSSAIPARDHLKCESCFEWSALPDSARDWL